MDKHIEVSTAHVYKEYCLFRQLNRICHTHALVFSRSINMSMMSLTKKFRKFKTFLNYKVKRGVVYRSDEELWVDSTEQ